jgi:hypothetical protein
MRRSFGKHISRKPANSNSLKLYLMFFLALVLPQEFLKKAHSFPLVHASSAA